MGDGDDNVTHFCTCATRMGMSLAGEVTCFGGTKGVQFCCESKTASKKSIKIEDMSSS